MLSAHFNAEVISALPIREVSTFVDLLRSIDEKLWRRYLTMIRSPLIDSDLRRQEWQLLKSIIAKPSVRRYLEIGVYHLGCVRQVSRFLKEKSNPKVLGVDLFDSTEARQTVTTANQTHVGDILTLAEARTRVQDLPFVSLRAGDSSRVLSDLHSEKAEFDAIFVDGNHAYEAAASDAENALKLLVKGGYLLLHNTSNDFNPDKAYIRADGGPYRVVEHLKRRPELIFLKQCERMSLFQYKIIWEHTIHY